MFPLERPLHTRECNLMDSNEKSSVFGRCSPVFQLLSRTRLCLDRELKAVASLKVRKHATDGRRVVYLRSLSTRGVDQSSGAFSRHVCSRLPPETVGKKKTKTGELEGEARVDTQSGSVAQGRRQAAQPEWLGPGHSGSLTVARTGTCDETSPRRQSKDWSREFTRCNAALIL